MKRFQRLLAVAQFFLLVSPCYAEFKSRVPGIREKPKKNDLQQFHRVTATAKKNSHLRTEILQSSKFSFENYMHLLETKPLITKSVSAAVVTILGNILSQQVVAVMRGAKLSLNWIQLLAFTLTGLLYVGPFYHYWFTYLASLQFAHWKPFQRVLAQISLDQTIGVFVFYTSYFYVFEFFESVASFRCK